MGGMDIFKCQKNTDGTWSDVILLGENVNTVLNEENPFVSSDGKRLYFSSQGHSGMGGFDIFYCDILDDNTYGEPVNLDYPLNTADDDLAFTPKEIEFDSYLSMYSKGDPGEVDIYRFEWIPESAQPVIVAFEQAEEDVEELTEVLDEASEEAAEAIEEATEEVAEVVEEATEEIEEVIEGTEEEEAIEEEVVETYLVKPVFFGFDSFELSENAKEKLNGLAAILNRFPTLEIQIIGHTDAIGKEDYNKQLAKKRAIAVVDYLQSEGIDNNRLSTMSKGETDPVAMNRTAENRDTPKGRALNRRVHFNVSAPNGIVIELEKINVPEELKLK